MHETLIGYDARIPERHVPALWPARAAGAVPAAPTCPAPLSVDPLAWPSVFDLGHGAGCRRQSGRASVWRATGGSAPCPPGSGRTRPCGRTSTRLRAFLLPGADGQPGWTLVAVTRCAEQEGGSLADLGPAWQRLGYDVADDGLISGLSNCGYGEEEAAEMRLAWSGRLNVHHLFDNPSLAFEFRALTGRRVPEHAPFSVYGLYVMEPE